MTLRSGAFLALLVLFGISPPVSHAASAPPAEFFSRVSRAVDAALKGRAGLAIWLDLESGTRTEWGGANLAGLRFRPGSLVKILLAEEAVSQNLKPEYHCTGRDRIEEQRRFCWKRKGHGDLDLPKALAQSCNLFFSRLGLQMGVAGLRSAYGRYPSFHAEDIPFDKLSSWDLADLAIGDSPYLRVSPGEVAEFWRSFLPKLQDPRYAVLKQGLEKAVETGTASRAAVAGLELVGKTGTSDSEGSNFKTDAWFLGAYPADRPRYALVIFLREAYGFREPSQLAAKIFRIAKETLP